MSRIFRTRAALMGWTLAGLAGVGILGGVAAAGTATASSHQDQAGGAVLLSAANSIADGTVPSASGSARSSLANQAPTARARLRLARQLAGRSVHGEIVLNTKNGVQTVDFQRGSVSSTDAGELSVTDAGGTTQNWVVDSNTRVRTRGQGAQPGTSTATAPQLAVGENVVVLGTRSGDTLTARLVLVVVNSPAGTGSGSGAAGSGLQG